jgi:hypothetical protein
MTQRRHHYEQAFEHYLRDRRVPYVAVNEARKALVPETASSRLGSKDASLKSFDFVLYGEPTNLLAEIKGRKVGGRPSEAGAPPTRSRLESWVTRDDVDSLLEWESLFGDGFRSLFVFVYWCDVPPPGSLFQEIFEFQGRWYALRGIEVADYAAHMKTRSPRWGTVHLPTEAFERLSSPLVLLDAGTECVAGR